MSAWTSSFPRRAGWLALATGALVSLPAYAADTVRVVQVDAVPLATSANAKRAGSLKPKPVIPPAGPIVVTRAHVNDDGKVELRCSHRHDGSDAHAHAPAPQESTR